MNALQARGAMISLNPVAAGFACLGWAGVKLVDKLFHANLLRYPALMYLSKHNFV